MLTDCTPLIHVIRGSSPVSGLLERHLNPNNPCMHYLNNLTVFPNPNPNRGQMSAMVVYRGQVFGEGICSKECTRGGPKSCTFSV